MKRSTTSRVMALLLLLFAVAIRPAGAAWQCEGRICGTTPWICCCDSPVAAQDQNCRVDMPADEPSGACSTGCGCTLILKAGHPARLLAPGSFSLGSLHVLLLSAPHPDVAPLPLEMIGRAIETRGPPLASVCLGTPLLRGPPSA